MVATNIMKCSLKPVDPADYAVPMKPAQLDRLRASFPQVGAASGGGSSENLERRASLVSTW
jgi:hypothetical protein